MITNRKAFLGAAILLATTATSTCMASQSLPATPTTVTLRLQTQDPNCIPPLSIEVQYLSIQTTKMLQFEFTIQNDTTVPLSWKMISRGLNVSMYDVFADKRLIPGPGIHDKPWLFWKTDSTIPEGELLPGQRDRVIYRCRWVPRSEIVFNHRHVRPIFPGAFGCYFSWIGQVSDPWCGSLSVSTSCHIRSDTFETSTTPGLQCLYVVGI